jgi:antitoxin MazE
VPTGSSKHRRGRMSKRPASRASTRGGTAGPQAVATRDSTVSRWGNSLGLRIPQEAADRLRLKAGDRVSVELRDGSIVIRPVRKRWTEAQLLKGVSPAMVGGEVDSGGPVGKEVW